MAETPPAKKPRKAAAPRAKSALATGETQPKAAKKPRTVAPRAPAKIFSIYYQEDQREQLDPAFIPVDNSGNHSHLLEFDVFRRLSESAQTQGAEYWGALSWKFNQKTGLTGAELYKIIEDNPGHDCYFCNPHPEVESLYHNIWIQGETAHPNFLQLAAEFFKAAGLDPQWLTAIFPSQYFAAANYFVANGKFWRAYLDFVGGVLAEADKNLPPRIKQTLHSSVADPKSVHADAGYWPFLVERLFSVFIATRAGGLKLFKFKTKASPALEANVHHKLLLQMKDAAWQSKSSWMAVCWVNYRNLYLAEAFGKGWMRKMIGRITPRSIVFV